MTISAIIITKNEEATIQRCLKSVAFANEVIVVDGNSTDNTTKLARELGATVYNNPWPGFGQQKNFGAQRAHGEWLLFIDADEEVSPSLQRAIQNALTAPVTDFYWLRIVTIFLGKPLQHLYGHNPRLFKKSAGQWSAAPVHEQVVRNDGSLLTLGDVFSQVITEPLLHHSHTTLASYFSSMHRYTSLDAEYLKRTGKHRSGMPVRPSWWLPWYLSMRQFLKLVLYRRGWQDGISGWLWCIVSAYYEWEMAQKFRRLSDGPH